MSYDLTFDDAHLDRYLIRIIPLSSLGETIRVDEVSLRERRSKARGPTLTIHWRRIVAPVAEGRVVLGTFGELSPRVYEVVKRAVGRIVADREEEIDIVRIIDRAYRGMR